MITTRMLKWSIVLLIAAVNLSNCADAESSDSARAGEESALKPMAKEAIEEGSSRSVRSPARVSGFYSEIQRFPFVQNLGLPEKKLTARRKRGSGVVIRGPFYPYPRPGHPLRFTSGGHRTASPSSSLLIVASVLTVSLVAFRRAWQ